MHLRRRVATFLRKMRYPVPVMTGNTISAARKTGIITLTFTA
jgi:hypothetical protein